MKPNRTPTISPVRLTVVVLTAAMAAANLAGCGPQPPAAPGQTAPTAGAPVAALVQQQQPVPSAVQPPAVQPGYPQADPAPSTPPSAYPQQQAQTYQRPYPTAGQPVPAAPVTDQDGPPPVVAHRDVASSATRVHRQPVASPAPVQVASNHVGRIASIEPITERPEGSGAGGVIGGVLGAVVGNHFGHGNGRAALTVLGGVGGAVAGNNVERNVKERVVGYRVGVTLDDGESRTYEEASADGLRVGDRVRVDGRGLRRV